MKQSIEIAIMIAAAMIVALFFVALFFTALAFARPPAGVAIDPAMHAWFESLQNPATGISCCGQSDGHIMDMKDVRNDGSAWQVRVNGAWVNVPPEAVLDRVDNPTGSFVAFWSAAWPDHIYCFVRPAMT